MENFAHGRKKQIIARIAPAGLMKVFAALLFS
jgi:hypothetical protein